jgi:hypothetical protein
MENTVVPSDTAEASNGSSGGARIDNIEHITETVDETMEAASPPQESAHGCKD